MNRHDTESRIAFPDRVLDKPTDRYRITYVDGSTETFPAGVVVIDWAGRLRIGSDRVVPHDGWRLLSKVAE
ncbi:hypothetical protein FOS14_18805 [Skermania sp. ID1734]|uniref:hypothetical protein n=1 Tax=Skermania sp. ID1734 TaxID=2597516 RepID=UPI00117E0903|nr:hypothetical protein [Skermania sp. ID1734]TSD95045.1 hypothetical protein FOS14_18805 [Skermania sp. ID1734]